MDAKQYWRFYRDEYYCMVGAYTSTRFSGDGCRPPLDEDLFAKANEFAAEQARIELEFQTWKSKGSYDPHRKLCYGEVVA